MERYWVVNGILASNECGGLVKYDDAQRALDALQAQLRQVEGQSQQQAEEAVIVFAKYTTLRQLVEVWRKLLDYVAAIDRPHMREVKRYVPRILRDDGMIPFAEVAHYTHLNLIQYVSVADHDAALRRAKAEGMRDAAKLVDDDCYIPGGQLLPDYEHRCKHNVNQKELAAKIRARAAQIEEGE